MKIDYTVTVEDLLLFNFYVQRKNLKLISILNFPVLLVLFVYGSLTSGPGVSTVILLIALGSFATGYFAIRSPLKTCITTTASILLLLSLLRLGTESTSDLAGMSIAFLPLVIGCIGGLAANKIMKSYYQGKNDMVGPLSLEITPDGLVGTSPTSSSKHQWEAVTAVETDRNNLYIFLGKLKAYVIPLASFKDESSKNGFLTSLETFRHKTV